MSKNMRTLNFAANLTMMFNELPFIERFAAASAAGFRAVEFLSPYAYEAGDITATLKKYNLKTVLFNAGIGAWNRGDRGISALPGRENEFQASMNESIEYARALGCPNLHVMAGLVDATEDMSAHRSTYVRNLRIAAAMAQAHGITLLIEPINHRDMPGYFLNRLEQALGVVREVDAPNLKIQLDFYHAQITEGDLATKLRRYLPEVGHIQIAGVPGRHEPNIGEINYPYLFSLLGELGYTGWIGCEYRPLGDTAEGLGWMKAEGMKALLSSSGYAAPAER